MICLLFSAASSRASRTVTASARRRGASQRRAPIEEEVARELSFEETTDADSEFGYVAPSASAFSVDRSYVSASKVSAGMKSPAQYIAERDSTIFQVDACDWVVQDPHDVLIPSTRASNTPKHTSVIPDLTLEHRAPVVPVAPPLPALPPVEEFWDVVYDVFPFVFKGPGIRIAIAIAGVAHKGTALKLEALHARYSSRPFHFPGKLLLVLALAAFFLLVSAPAVAYLRAQTSAGPVKLSGGGVVTEQDMNRIGDRVLAAVKANVGALDLVVMPQLVAAENKLTTAFTGLNTQLGARATQDLTALRVELLKSLQSEITSAVSTGKSDLSAFEKAAQSKFVVKPELVAVAAKSKADVDALAAAAKSAYVTHPELDAVEKTLRQWTEQQIAAQTAKTSATLTAAAAAAGDKLRAEFAAAAAAASTGTAKDIELVRVKLTSLVETEVLRASQASQTSWTAALEKMRLELAGGNLAETLTVQIRSKIMDGVTADATKAAMAAAERAGKASFDANLAASVKAAKEAAAEVARAEADRAIAAAMLSSTAAVAGASQQANVAESRVAAAIEKAHSAAADAARAQAEAAVSGTKASHAEATAKEALAAATKLSEQSAVAAATLDARFKDVIESAFAANSPAWSRARAELLAAAATAAGEAAASMRASLEKDLAAVAATVAEEKAKLAALTASVSAVEARVGKTETELAALRTDSTAARTAADSASAAVVELRKRVEVIVTASATGSSIDAAELQRVTALVAAVEERAAAAAKETEAVAKQAKDAAAAAASAAATGAEAKQAAAAAKDAAAGAASAAQVEALERQIAQLSAVAAAAKDAAAKASAEAEAARAASAAATAAAAAGMDAATLRSRIDDALEVFAADRTAMVDFAAKGAGGRVLAHTATHTPQYSSNQFMSWLTSCYVPTKAPETLIEAGMEAGSCWPMAGSHGFVFLQLIAPIKVSKITLQHLSHTIATNITTAPRGFRLHGVTAQAAAAWRDAGAKESDEPAGALLGEFAFDALGPRALQTFTVAKSAAAEQVYSHVKVEVLSNHGNQDFTCIYRVRIHGETAKVNA